MPYKKVGNNDYVSPSGKHINGNQLKLWYANGQKWPGEKHSEGNMSYAKGGDIAVASYAAGGPVLGRTREFLKEPVSFRTDTGPGARQDYGGNGDENTKRTGDKSLKAVKPRK